jgi:outer membrane protein OmpA-like peptidoglycan-associated protein
VVANTKELSGHSLFSVPVDHKITTILLDSEFEKYKSNSALLCAAKACINKTDGFDSSGYLNLEGKIKSVVYARSDRQQISKLLILKNYQKIAADLLANQISDSKHDGMNAFLIENSFSKIWILLDLQNSSEYFLTIVEQSVARDILKAGQLAEQIRKQGFVNLNVNFDTNKSLIKDADKPAINEVVALLKNDLNLKLSVEGHTDNVGNAAANKTLSQARSDSLVAYIVAAGIPAKRLMAKGFGSESPISDNRTDEGKAKNRRVELVKIK